MLIEAQSLPPLARIHSLAYILQRALDLPTNYPFRYAYHPYSHEFANTLDLLRWMGYIKLVDIPNTIGRVVSVVPGQTHHWEPLVEEHKAKVNTITQAFREADDLTIDLAATLLFFTTHRPSEADIPATVQPLKPKVPIDRLRNVHAWMKTLELIK